tara:strand:+ start:24303 stop:25037 length:735 start_codon:yes stop_codon:yes gene_type:complete
MTCHLVITGDSHLAAISQGAEILDECTTLLSFLPLGGGHLAPQQFFRVDPATRRVEITIDGWSPVAFPVASADGGLLTDALYVVSLPCNTSRFLRDYDWTTYVPWQFKNSPDEIPLSDAIIEKIICSDAATAVAFVAQLKAVGLDTCVVEAPRYFAHAAHVRSMRPEVCTYLSARFLTFVRDRLHRCGIPVVEQPESTIGPDGSTLPRYRHPSPEDEHHASAEYGALMLERVLSFARTALHDVR